MDTAEPRILNVEGKLVALGPLRRDLLPTYQCWMNDFPTLRWLGAPVQPMTLERETAWYDHESTATEPIGFTIYARATPPSTEPGQTAGSEPGWRPIGTCALHPVDHRHGTAELITLIGDPESRGKGYGTEAVRLLLDYAFTALGLHNVKLGVDETNLAGRRAYEKAGFKEVGRRRQAIRELGRWHDEIVMDCLATEFESPVLAAVFRPDRPAGGER